MRGRGILVRTCEILKKGRLVISIRRVVPENLVSTQTYVPVGIMQGHPKDSFQCLIVPVKGAVYLHAHDLSSFNREQYIYRVGNDVIDGPPL